MSAAEESGKTKRHGRRAARECALKSLYAQGFNEDRMEQVVQDVMEKEALPDEFQEFCRNLALKTLVHSDEFNTLIKKKAEHWEFERIAIIDKLILRMALCEILYFEEIPPKVSITEAIEIAKDYSTEKSGAFVNGILDSVLQDLKNEGRIFLG